MTRPGFGWGAGATVPAEIVGWLGVHEWEAAIDGMVTRVVAETRAAVVEASSTVERKAKEHSEGRPGPNIVSGHHRRGIKTEAVKPWGVGGWMTRVGPTMSYSRRLELGFQDVDSLGRHYNQPPYPSLGPAYRETPFDEIFTKHWRAAI
jgi:hypothetical protein